MPLIKRGIEPVNLSRAHVAPGVKNELECVTNSTLANVIRQLSSLSKHAEDLFSELASETAKCFHRANQLTERVDRLKVKVTQLDSTGEEVSLQDIHMRKPFKSSMVKEQQIIGVMTRPQAIVEVYNQCDAPPPLDKLNPYREDGKDSRKFYTDPNYFVELWFREMQKDTENNKKEIRKKHKKLYHHPHGQHHPQHHHQHPQQHPQHPQQPPQQPLHPQQQQQHPYHAQHPSQQQQQALHPQQPPQSQPQQVQPQQSPSSQQVAAVTISNHARPKTRAPQHIRQPNRRDFQKLKDGPELVDEPPRPDPASGGGYHGVPSQQGPDPTARPHERSPSRPISLELQQDASGQYVPASQANNSAYGPQGRGNHVSAYVEETRMSNGPVEGGGGRGAPPAPQYQQPPAYGQSTPGADLVGYGGRGADSPREVGSPRQPGNNRATVVGMGGRQPAASVVSPRPVMPPPAPPGVDPLGSNSLRESLPPPPPPPPADGIGNHIVGRATPPYSPGHLSGLRDPSGSPARSSPSPQHYKSGTPDSNDLPPPPPPPPLSSQSHTPDTPGSISSMLPPPPTPPPPELHELQVHGGMAPPPPPPPPPPMLNGTLPPPGRRLIPNGDALSLVSSASSTTRSEEAGAADGAADPLAAEGEDGIDDRSDLLSAIREGIKLRKVEERRLKDEQKRAPTGRLDVQQMMEAAFEMRRKALEAGDSEDDEEEEEDGEWSGED